MRYLLGKRIENKFIAGLWTLLSQKVPEKMAQKANALPTVQFRVLIINCHFLQTRTLIIQKEQKNRVVLTLAATVCAGFLTE